jgi:hypothetical protein
MSVVATIDFSTGDLTQFTTTVTDGGEISAAAGAALAGTNYGMSVLIDDTTAAFGRKVLAAAYPTLRYRFYIDPNSLTMADTNEFRVMNVNQSGGSYYSPTYINLYMTGGNYTLRLFQCRDTSGGVVATDNCTITDAPHYVEVNMVSAATSSSSDGSYQWWVDDVDQGTLTGVDNYNIMNDNALRLLWGAQSNIDVGTSGTFYLDELIANNDGGAIGPLATSTPLTVGNVAQSISWRLAT